jgi:hypothetical protein
VKERLEYWRALFEEATRTEKEKGAHTKPPLSNG